MSTVLSEDEIRQLLLNGANLVPRQTIDNDDEKVHALKRVTSLFHQASTTLQADITVQHRTVACNLLSTIIEKCSQSQETDFQLLLWREECFWTATFRNYLNLHHTLNVKPSRLLLTTLTSTLAKCQDKSACETTKTSALELLGQSISRPSENMRTRPAMQALSHWLSKKVVSVDDLCLTLGKSSQKGPTGSLKLSLQELLDIVLYWSPYDDFASSAGSLTALILQKSLSSTSEIAFGQMRDSLWVPTILKILEEKPQSLEILRHYVFPEIFPSDRSGFVTFLEALGIHITLGGHGTSNQSLPLPTTQCEEVLFCALSVGSRLGLVRVADTNQETSDGAGLSIDKGVLCISDTLLGSLLVSISDAVRIAGLSMLTTTTATTKPLSMGALASLRTGLPFLHADSDAGLRSELFSLIKHLVERLKAATANLARPSGKQFKAKTKSKLETPLDATRSAELLDAHHAFLRWYVSFLKTELRPTASYQAHVSALKCLAIVARSGVDPNVPDVHRLKSAGPVVAWPFQHNVIDEEMVDLLIDLLLDPFDEVRSTTAEVLSLVENVSLQADKVTGSPVLVRVLAQAEDMMKTSGRADQADGVAHLYGILFSQSTELTVENGDWWTSKCGILEHLVDSIEKTLQTALADIGKAVSKHPLHGLFTSLRYIVERPGFYHTMTSNAIATSCLQSLYRRLYKDFQVVWSCVYGTLCNEAPEGFVPDELDEEDVGTKDVLSYSWRALKESSLLLRAIVKSCPIGTSEDSLLSPAQLRSLGDLTFTELAELRHRGAFSTVAQTFMACCARCNTGNEAISETLEDWYKRALLCIQNQTTINTRRSAGIPSLMIGIIVADSKGMLFGRAMADLTVEALKPVNPAAETAGGLSQVHAMNCMKDIFKNSKLGERSESGVPAALEISAKCLSSDTWAVRNSGLMLFRALMDRLIGTNDSYADDDTPTQSRLSEEATTSLMKVILRLLAPADGDSTTANAEVVFPALQLLQRVQPPANMLATTLQSVLHLIGNSQWHVRDKAARTYSILVPTADRIKYAVDLIGGVYSSQNRIHGSLMATRYLIERQGARLDINGRESVMVAIQQRIDDLLYDNICPYTQAAFVDVQAAYFWSCVQAGQSSQAQDTRWASIEEMHELLNLSHEQFVACAAFRQSLALSTIYEYSASGAGKDMAAMVKTFTMFARLDADACATALVHALQATVNQSRPTEATVKLLTTISISLLFDQEVVDVEVRDAAQDVLYRLSSLDTINAGAVHEQLLHQSIEPYLPPNFATPLFSDKRIVLQGLLLNLRFEGWDVPGRNLAEDTQGWVTSVRSALHEQSPYDTRVAAVRALQQIGNNGLEQIMSQSAYTNSCLDFCLAVYDLNNDDDDEIRTVAAIVTCRIFNAAGFKTSEIVPVAANAKLAEILPVIHGKCTPLALAAVSRMTGGAITASTVKPVRQILSEKSKQDMALFMQEKQNLFIDDTRETKIWSHILSNLPASSFSREMQQNLATWTMDGLNVLLAEVSACPDTPLGWSRKREVFVLGMQVLFAARALLQLSDELGALPVSKEGIKEELEQVMEKGKENGANVLWVKQIEEMLSQ